MADNYDDDEAVRSYLETCWCRQLPDFHLVVDLRAARIS
jgi:hypothetical protein